jgi:SAM-dependent methyltransferase
MDQPGSPTAFEALVDVYDAARPRYPAALYDALPDLSGRVLELGAGTGIATRELSPGVPVAVCRSEALPFADGAFDVVCGAQMWHWVDPEVAAAEVRRVLRPGGTLAVWWNEVDADGLPWWDAQQDRLEAGNPRYGRDYRQRDYGEELAPFFGSITAWSGSWERELDWPTYEKWLRSKSYVQALVDVEEFIRAEEESLLGAFPDGRIVEPFRVRLWRAST